ncbi:MAG: hypothetical protein HY902_04525 [Deltaproteobacteria bacterium]|nr:hypothetical protein [Deltaproteobacteria bacterium]
MPRHLSWLLCLALLLGGAACSPPQQGASGRDAAAAGTTGGEADAPPLDAAADTASDDQLPPADSEPAPVDATAEPDGAADATAAPDGATATCAPLATVAALPAQNCGATAGLPTWAAPQTKGGAFSFACPAAAQPMELQATFLLDGAVRLRYMPSGGPAAWPTRAVLDQPDLPAGAVGYGQTCLGAAVCAAGLALHVDAACRVRAVDAEGTAILEDTPDGGFAATATGPSLVRAAPPGERYYGLGAKTGGLDRRGKTWVLRSTDAYVSALGGYDPAGDPLYLAIPWLLTKRGASVAGVLTDNSYKQVYDLAASQPDRWRVTAQVGPLDQIVVAGPSAAQVLDRYTQLTGRPFLPPRWALGWHQSRWGYPDSAAFVQVAQKYRALQIPCDSLWFDIQKMQGFRSFTWDPAKFADPKGLTAQLHDLGFQAVAIVDPGLKADPSWPPYQQGLAGQYFLPAGAAVPYQGQVWPGAAAFPDFTNPKTRAWWAGTLVPQETALGTDALWIDMNEPSDFTANQGGTVPDELAVDGDGHPATMAAAHNLYALRMAEATQLGLQQAYPQRRPFVLSRAGYAGIQRHAANWTGDAPSTAATLAGTLPMLLGMGLSGQPLAGSDVGGYSGSADPALFARWLALGSVSPFFRGHAEQNAPPQEPWQFGQEVQDLSRSLIGARYRLLPYWEALADAAHRTGAPPLRPLWWHFASALELETVGDQALLGPFVLVAPHLSPTATTRSVVFPAGRWLQAQSGAVIEGPTTLQVSGPLADLPLWLRQGAIVPRGPLRQWTGQDVSGPLDLDVVPGPEPSELVLRLDAGDGPANAAWRRTRLQQKPVSAGTELAASIEPGSTFSPPAQDWRIRLWRLDVAPSAVVLQGQPVPQVVDALLPGTTAGWSWDANERSWRIRLPAAIASGPWLLQVTHPQSPQGPPLLPAPTIDVPLTVQVPPNTPSNAPIFVAHSGNGWAQQPLQWTATPGIAKGVVTVPRGQWFEYKYTRGDWSTVEKYPGCVEAKNRYAFGAVHTVSLDQAGQSDQVWAWADGCK